jgi:hypothetical protein
MFWCFFLLFLLLKVRSSSPHHHLREVELSFYAYLRECVCRNSSQNKWEGEIVTCRKFLYVYGNELSVWIVEGTMLNFFTL